MKPHLFTILFFIIVINLLLIHQRRVKGRLVAGYESEFRDVSLENRVLADLFFEKLERKPVYDLMSVDELGKLKSVVDKGILAFSFSNRSCHSCVENELINIRDLAPKIGKDNIILISFDHSVRELKELRIIFGLQDIRLIEMPPNEIGSKNNLPDESPLYFVLDTLGFANMIFRPEPAYPFISEKYLEKIVEFFSLN